MVVVEDIVYEIECFGVKVIVLCIDVLYDVDVCYVIDMMVDIFGCFDFVFNNVGIVLCGVLVVEFDEDEWDCMFVVNLKGVWLCIWYECWYML